MIKGSGLYAVNGVYFPTQSGVEATNTFCCQSLFHRSMKCNVQVLKQVSPGKTLSQEMAWERSNILTCCKLTQCENLRIRKAIIFLEFFQNQCFSSSIKQRISVYNNHEDLYCV